MAEENGVMGLFIFVILIIGVGIPLTHHSKTNIFNELRTGYHNRKSNRIDSNHSRLHTSIFSASSTDICSKNEWLLGAEEYNKSLNDERGEPLSDFFITTSEATT